MGIEKRRTTVRRRRVSRTEHSSEEAITRDSIFSLNNAEDVEPEYVVKSRSIKQVNIVKPLNKNLHEVMASPIKDLTVKVKQLSMGETKEEKKVLKDIDIVEQLYQGNFELQQAVNNILNEAAKYQACVENKIKILKEKKPAQEIEDKKSPSMDDAEYWEFYLPPIQSPPTMIRNNTLKTRRSLPSIWVSVKNKIVPVIIDPALSMSFMSNDIYNLYVQSQYTKSELQYSEYKKKRETAYCWWSQKRALTSTAQINLPVIWSTAGGEVEDTLELNVVKPNVGIVNGYIVLGRDFYTKKQPLFCLQSSMIAFKSLHQENLNVKMKVHWFTVTDQIPIVDPSKGPVYFIDKYEKNNRYRKSRANRSSRLSSVRSIAERNQNYCTYPYSNGNVCPYSEYAPVSYPMLMPECCYYYVVP